jgi:hypothetical protein
VAALGSKEIAAGAVLIVLFLLYLVFDLGCSFALGCYYSFPAFLTSFDGIFLSLVVLLLGIMLLAAGLVRRMRSRLPTRF